MTGLIEVHRDDDRIVLDLLKCVEENGDRSQRHIAVELGIALGLVNAYLKRCIKKGLVKVNNAPARRYAYYLTPQGFSEKSRLTVQYLSDSFSFFRQAKSDCASILNAAQEKGFSRFVLAGQSDLAEIVMLCAVDASVSVIAIVDPWSDADRFLGISVVSSYAKIDQPFDGVIVTDLVRARSSFDVAVSACGADLVWVPSMLGLPLVRNEEAI